MHDDAIRQRARTIYESRGLSHTATVTGIGRSTLKRWAKAEGWQTPGTVHTPRSPVRAPVPPTEWTPQKSNGDHSAHSGVHSRDPASELQADADLARRVYRQQAAALLDGHGKPVWFRDVTVAHGIMQDKRASYGAPAGLARDEPGLSEQERRVRREARIERLIQICEQVEAREDGNGDGPAQA